MALLEILIIALVLFGVAAVATGRLDGMAPAPADSAERELPDRPLTAADVEGVRLDVVLRGYRMSTVDALLARLAGELRDRDAEIERLRAAARPRANVAGPAGGESARERADG